MGLLIKQPVMVEGNSSGWAWLRAPNQNGGGADANSHVNSFHLDFPETVSTFPEVKVTVLPLSH